MISYLVHLFVVGVTVGAVIGEDSSTDFHDPRSEIRQKVTSGEEHWSSISKRDKSDSKSRPTTPGSTVDPFEMNISEEFTQEDGSFEEYLQYKIPSNLDKELRSIMQLDDHIDRITFATIKNSAEAGSLDSAFFTGLIFLYGFANVSKDPLKAIEWLRRGATSGHAESQCGLGLLLYYGIQGIIGIDRKTAMLWFHRAAKDSSYARGYWLLGKALYDGMKYDDVGIQSIVSKEYKYPSLLNGYPDYDEVARLFAKAAGDIVPEAFHQIGVLFEYGLIQTDLISSITSKDIEQLHQNHPSRYTRAITYYEEAARLNFTESAYHLGLMYAYGRGVSKSYPMATNYFRCGASHGHAQSLRHLAIFAFNGYGQPHDISDPGLAIFWFKECIRVSHGEMKMLCETELNEIQFSMETSKGFKDMVRTKLALQMSS